jgi:hypothetical protein
MSHRIALTLASVTVILAGLTVQGRPAQATPCPEPEHHNCGWSITPRLTASDMVVTSYFAALNKAMATGNVSGVTAFYSRTASLTLRTSSGQTRTLHGLPAIKTYITTQRAASKGATWQVDEMRDLDSTVVLAYVHATVPSSSASAHWADVFVIKSNRIVSLDAIAL